jgi:serine/threonine protein kinase/Tol biopolymer transport system component
MSKLSPDQWQALSPYLDRALELEDDDRSAWLAALRGENPVIAAQLEMLLGEHRALAEEGFLEEKTPQLPRGQGLAGQVLGVYTLISQIGHGGMGTVWLAERNDGRFERRVAIKMLNMALMGKGGEERFKREGRILGRLTHPHIAELIDAGVSATGEPFLVLEYVDGEPIDRYCDQNGLDIRARIRLFLDALQGVAQAHAHHIVHRDLKPSNILVRTDGEAKLLDFGIAKLLECDGKNAEAPLTVEGGGAMTPEYAAPEQLKGEAVTAATDVYASGVLLYVLVTGRHPTGTDSRTPARLVKAIVDVEPPRPSDVVASAGSEDESAAANARRRAITPERLIRLLRGDLDTIVGKALKKNPQDRYPSIESFAEDLQRYLYHQPIIARPDTLVYRTTKFIRRNATSVTAGLLVTAALAGTATVTWIFPRRAEPLAQFNQRKLTANAQDSPIFNAAISPDGKYLAFADKEGLHLQVVDTRAVQNLALPFSLPRERSSWDFGSWYPDSTRFTAALAIPGLPSTMWSIPTNGGEPQKVADVENLYGGGIVSPDGANIAYERLRSASGAREIWLMAANGEDRRKIITAEPQTTIQGMAWSPSGKRIAYHVRRQRGDRIEILVQSCDLRGVDVTTIIQDSHLTAFIWLPSGRFIYSRNTEIGSAQSDNLWEIQVDARSGTHRGDGRQLTDWSGFSVYSFSATEDGKQLSFLRGNTHASVFVGDLNASGNRLVNSRRLTLDDNYNLPSAWTPDSREVIFSSQRATNRLMYRQALDQGSEAHLITPAGEMNFYLARLSPDGAWILLEGGPISVRKLGLYRVGLNGGVPQLIFNTEGFVPFGCTAKAANLCVYGRPSAGKNELVVAAFDPLKGPGKELIRIPLAAGSNADIGFDYSWHLSPDGSQIALLKRHGNQIQLAPLAGSQSRTITAKGYADLVDFSWAPDSRSLFVSAVDSAGVSLLNLTLNGAVQPLWHQAQPFSIWGFPSPNGRHLAILGASSESNAWIINNF